MFIFRFSGYPASMLYSEALAAAATALASTAEQQTDCTDQLTDSTKSGQNRLDTDNLVARLQILTRVENVSDRPFFSYIIITLKLKDVMTFESNFLKYCYIIL